MTIQLVLHVALIAYFVAGSIVSSIILLSGKLRRRYGFFIEIIQSIYILLMWPFVIKDMNIKFNRTKGFSLKFKTDVEVEDHDN